MSTSIFTNLNWLAIALATVAYFMLGALWYSGLFFGKKWAALVGIDMSANDSKKGLGKMMAGSLMLTLITVIALAVLIQKLELTFIISAVKLALLTGICFATTAVSISFIYESRPCGLYFIDCGYHLAGHVVASIVLVMI